MKVKHLKCPACGGSIQRDLIEPHMGTCEYCKSKIQITDGFQSQCHYDYQEEVNHNNREDLKREKKVMIGIAVACLIFFICLSTVKPKPQPTVQAPAVDEYHERDQKDQESDSIEPEIVENVIWENFLVQVFEKPLELITVEELSQIKYLLIKEKGLLMSTDSKRTEWSRSEDFTYYFTYGFEQFEESGQNPNVFTITATGAEDFDISCLNQLPGLTSLSFADRIKTKQLSGLHNLTAFSCLYMEPEEIAEMLPCPEQIIRLNLEGREVKLTGLGQFTGLRELDITNSDVDDIKVLAANKELEIVRFKSCDEIVDLSILAIFPHLKEVWMDTEKVKDIGFLKDLQELQKLTIENTDILNLDALIGNESLVELVLKGNHEVENYHPIDTLINLRSLIIGKGTSKDDPDLSRLMNLEYLKVSGFMDLQSIRSLKNLKQLEVSGCRIDREDIFSGMTALETIKCGSFWGDYEGISFITRLPNLKSVELDEVELYTDLSPLLNKSTLESLVINKGTHEINFKKLQDNPNLKKLVLTEVKLTENNYMERNGMMTSRWYDKVNLDDHTSFLTHYSGLESLNLQNNKITNIAFAEYLPNLKVLDINHNYVTDIRPLEHLEFLERVSCRDNPITNFEMLRGKVTIIR